jgi:hypothetical protein
MRGVSTAANICLMCQQDMLVATIVHCMPRSGTSCPGVFVTHPPR